jgi:predicted nucleic acid-binding protein
MILLDTNVVSELVQPWPNPRVLAWLESRIRDKDFIDVGLPVVNPWAA